MNDLPNEVLEFIISLIPPYNDYNSCKLVCKRWMAIVESNLIHNIYFSKNIPINTTFSLKNQKYRCRRT